MEVLGHDSYMVKVDGSNRVTKRNRQFLRRITPYTADTDNCHPPILPPVACVPAIPIDSPDSLEDTVGHNPDPGHDRQPVHGNPVDPASPPEDDLAHTSDHTPDTEPAVPAVHVPTTAPQPRQIPKHLKERWIVNPELVRKRPNEQAAMYSPAQSRMKWDIHELEEDYPILSQIISHMLLAYLAS